METKNTKETQNETKEAQNDTKALSKQEAKELRSTGFFFVVPLCSVPVLKRNNRLRIC